MDPPPARVCTPGSRLTYAEREEISRALRARASYRAIARRLGRGKRPQPLVTSAVAKRRSASHPAVARWIEDARQQRGIEACKAFFAFPEPQRRRLRSTNGLERLNEELERRTRVVRLRAQPDASIIDE